MPQGLPLSAYKAALFDVDGTLVDSLRVFVQGLGDTYEHYLGFRPSEPELRSLCGIPLRQQLRLFQNESPTEDQLTEMVAYAISRYEVYQSEETVHQGAVETLRLCHQSGMKTALVTSKNAVELRQFLKRFEAALSVDITVCASDVFHPKPDPESAFLACERLGVKPEEAIFIGDSVYDLRCAKSAGATPIAVGFGASDRATLLAENPAVYFDTPDELLEWACQSLHKTSCQERK